MYLIGTLCALAIAALTVFLIYDIVRRYLKATGSIWERLKAAGQNSATMIWMKFVALLGAVVFNLDSAAQAIGLPQLESYVNQLTANPKTVAIVMLVVSGIGAVARLRTL